VTSLAAACGVSHNQVAKQPSTVAVLFRDGFDDPAAIQQRWVAVAPNIVGAHTHAEDEALRLSSATNKEEIAVRHRFALSSLGGKRLRLRARARTSTASALARVAVTAVRANGVPSYADQASTRTVNTTEWSNIDAVIDLDPAAVTGELSLVLRGTGDAWFDDVEVSVLGDAPRPAAVRLSPQQIEHLVTFARAYGHIRFLHPSDQSATCDWSAFVPAAISHILRVRDRKALRDELTRLFAPLAPTVTFAEAGTAPSRQVEPERAGTHLARWWHFGLGPSGMYASFREGRDEEELYFERSVRIKLAAPAACRSARLDAKLRREGAGEASLFLSVQRPGDRAPQTDQKIESDTRAVSLERELAADLQELRAGVRLTGHASVTLEQLSLVCQNGQRVAIPIDAHWEARGYSSLSRWTVAKCATGTCGTLERQPLDTALVPERDIRDIDIGSGLRMRMPLAVWADAHRTYPARTDVAPLAHDATINDLWVRLAAVTSTWATLGLFYPYFEDQDIDWNKALPAALRAAAMARSPEETHEVLSQLVARLQDDHARVSHDGAPTNGIVPLALRRFEDKLVVVGGLPQYTASLPIGTEVVSIDGTPAMRAYDRIRARVSAATVGWHEYATSFYLTVGVKGSFRQFVFRLANGDTRAGALPLVSRDLYDADVREPRPKTGAEVAPGVYYVDFEGLKAETWRGLLPSLENARALVYDLRGYTTNAAMETIAHLTDRELPSPSWEVPVVGLDAKPRYEVSRWSLFPAIPRLKAPVVVLMDGRSASAVETTLQMLRDAKLAFFVGEPSGGTNGNTNTFSVPGDFKVRFTGLRAGSPDGTTVQGRGIQPDKLVRPTLEGIRSGRDEILEAGIAQAQRLARQ
jgi:hypothetical protein